MVGESLTTSSNGTGWVTITGGCSSYSSYYFPRPRDPYPWERRLTTLLNFIKKTIELFGRFCTGWIPGHGYGGIYMPPEDPAKIRPLEHAVVEDRRSQIRKRIPPRHCWPPNIQAAAPAAWAALFSLGHPHPVGGFFVKVAVGSAHV